MTGAPLRTPLLRAAEAMAACITDTLTEPPSPDFAADDYGPRSTRWYAQSLSRGAAGLALLHGVRAQTGHGGWGPVHAWLRRATADTLNNGSGAGLWFGAPAVTHALTMAMPHSHPTALDALDHALDELVERRLAAATARLAARARPSLSEFDLVRGLTGLGAHLLLRAPDGPLLRRVLAYLVRLTEPVHTDDAAGRLAPGWWSADPADREGSEQGGHANVGMAHGIAGPLALLALAMRQDIRVPGHAEAIRRICTWLDCWQQTSPAGPWWPEKITVAELRAGKPSMSGPARPSWCYGTPGVARAQQLAGIALDDDARQEVAEEALIRCLADHLQLSRIVDPSLCHGWAGLAATAWYAAADARTTSLQKQLPQIVRLLIQHATDTTPARSGLITGPAGIALTLHTVATGTDVRWATSLLIN
ncbi:lanthionine synthetase C family protein [Micromonospora sp. WMMD1102]|uniref:lanthionine synthetase C family protein n=1 Tax=Micromonospora sp. WMMD1102 TaxID=3016105 RepID=UPI0024156D4B|nr:lanthionine synthetase C family protein [Micromonospora sp. WMMD1102]MDG4787677.1 lanthionine synthetase C family protein [Micromonospora sp. WMMD1102]